jgi:hypothetical protein
MLFRVNQSIKSCFFDKVVGGICHRDEVELVKIILCLKPALILLMSAVAFLTGDIHSLSVK